MTTEADKPEESGATDAPQPKPPTRRRTSARTDNARAARSASRSKTAPASAPVDSAVEQKADAAGLDKPGQAKRVTTKAPIKPQPRLMARYKDEIRKRMIEEFEYASAMQAPKVEKVVVNVGLGEALTNNRALETAPDHVMTITGQKPVITKARRSIAGFKVREGQAIGVMVTLRGRRMYEFLDRLINVALPRIRDFRGVSRTSFDGNGNYSLGLREQIVFPEIDYGSVDRTRGLQVTITTSATNDLEGFRLLELLGMPFARNVAA